MRWWHWVAIGAVALLGGGATVAVVDRRKKEAAAGVVGPDAKPLTSEDARINQLLPQVQLALRRLRAALEAEGIKTYVGSTRRNPDEQAANVAKGVSATKNSWHLLGRAVDLYPYDPSTNKPDLAGRQTALFFRMHQVAATLGWRGLAFQQDGSKRYITTSKGKVWDGGHIEFPEGMTFAQASATGTKPKGGMG